MSSPPHDVNKAKGILITGESLVQGLHGATLTGEKLHSINFKENNKKFCLSLHYNASNIHLFINGVEIIKIKANDSESVAIP